jgi:hypothetical protein
MLQISLNGPQVIEQEAGIEEYDSRDRPFIWSMTGGEIRGTPLAMKSFMAVLTALTPSLTSASTRPLA